MPVINLRVGIGAGVTTTSDVDFLSLRGGCRIWAGLSPELNVEDRESRIWPGGAEVEKWVADHWIEALGELEVDETVALSLGLQQLLRVARVGSSDHVDQQRRSYPELISLKCV